MGTVNQSNPSAKPFWSSHFVFHHWHKFMIVRQAPEHEPLARLPVTGYSLTCTPSEGDSCSETLPADTTSYDLTVVAGVQYTITVSALSNGRESQNITLNFSTYAISFLQCMTVCTMQLFVCLRHLELKQLAKKLFFTEGTIMYSAIFFAFCVSSHN